MWRFRWVVTKKPNLAARFLCRSALFLAELKHPRRFDGIDRHMDGGLGRKLALQQHLRQRVFNALLNHPDFEKLDFSGLQVSLGGGMAVQHAVADRWRKVTGRTLIEAYGLTETSPAVCINRPDQEEFSGSIGLPVPSTEISIRNDDGLELPLGEAGELCVRGPQVMKGYYRRPDETVRVMSDDGYLRTGDIATVDDKGFVRIVDRKKDMILVSGFNVYPNEVEDVVASCPGVLEC